MSGARELPGDLLILAAVERAQCHWGRSGRAGAPMSAILEHLDVGSRTHKARHVRGRVGELVDQRLLETHRHRSMWLWAIAAKGSDLLGQARASGRPPVLPESPQHRFWRDAHDLAEQQIDRLREEVGTVLAKADGLLAGDRPGGSDAWFETAQEVEGACKRLGSAIYCLHEWAEPDDQAPDVDNHEDPADAGLSRRQRSRLRALRQGRRSRLLRSCR